MKYIHETRYFVIFLRFSDVIEQRFQKNNKVEFIRPMDDQAAERVRSPDTELEVLLPGSDTPELLPEPDPPEISPAPALTVGDVLQKIPKMKQGTFLADYNFQFIYLVICVDHKIGIYYEHIYSLRAGSSQRTF